MGWEDPSPLRGRPRPARQAASPSGVAAATGVSLGRVLLVGACALVAGAVAYAVAAVGVALWRTVHPSPPAAFDTVVALAAGGLVAALAWRRLLARPPRHGLPLQVRDGGGYGRDWFAPHRSGNSGYGATTGGAIAIEVASDLIGVAVDAAID